MSSTITLRPVSLDDAEMLLEWRNDPETRGASHNQDPVDREEHIAWLTRQLANPDMRMLIAEHDGRAVGTVRAEADRGAWQLSWTVAPPARGQGHAKAMVAALANSIKEPVRAEIKTGNMASIKVAEYAGMSFQSQADDVLHYGRGAQTDS